MRILPEGTFCEECQKDLKSRSQHYDHIQIVHVEDFKLCTICEHVQKNPVLAKSHLKRKHKAEFDANADNFQVLLTDLSNDLFGSMKKAPVAELDDSETKTSENEVHDSNTNE